MDKSNVSSWRYKVEMTYLNTKKNTTISIKNEMPMEKAIDLFLDAYEIDTEEEKNIFAYELEHLAKSIKRWSLNGYSENEITKLEQRVVNEVKIGRNDPCLCGSKKKYKKCCGR